MTCQHCSADLTGRRRQYCDRKCRDAAQYARDKANGKRQGPRRYPSREFPCAACGEVLVITPGKSLPPGKATHRACRPSGTRPTLGPRRSPKTGSCLECNAPCWPRSKRCWDCAQRPTRSPDDHRSTRAAREKAAPGLTRRERDELLQTWKAQHRKCAYCPALANTVDHVVPLVRGGTNYEGNLAPCCRSCNGSKSGYMVSEWLHGWRLPPRSEPLPWRATPRRPSAKPKRKAKRWELADNPFRVCVCGTAYVGNAKACSVRCHARSAYRERVGIPLGAAPYTVRAKSTNALDFSDAAA